MTILYLLLAVLVILFVIGLPSRAALWRAGQATRHPAVRYALLGLGLALLRGAFPAISRWLAALRFFR
jgi:hypothetical protein